MLLTRLWIMVLVARRPVALIRSNVFEGRKEGLAFRQHTIERQSFLVVNDNVLD